ncbi:hypothetical protein DAMA08_042850 [Martiniozyma asiatica (nom. inval.)]|nr:hypothetical protein DAMA08_042850 [Martiniozyma asiatica]
MTNYPKRPSSTPLDALIIDGIKKSITTDANFKTFKLYKVETIQNYIHRSPNHFTEGLSATMGIVLNTKTGYLIHISSLENTSGNKVFQFNSKISSTLKSIISKCTDGDIDFKLLKKEISDWYIERKIVNEKILKGSKFFPVTPQYCLPENVNNLGPFVPVDPFVNWTKVFHCDICLKSGQSKSEMLKHVRTHKMRDSIKFLTSGWGMQFGKGWLGCMIAHKVLDALSGENNNQIEIKHNNSDPLINQLLSRYFISILNEWSQVDTDHYFSHSTTLTTSLSDKFLIAYDQLKNNDIQKLPIVKKSYLQFYLSEDKGKFNFLLNLSESRKLKIGKLFDKVIGLCLKAKESTNYKPCFSKRQISLLTIIKSYNSTQWDEAIEFITSIVTDETDKSQSLLELLIFLLSYQRKSTIVEPLSTSTLKDAHRQFLYLIRFCFVFKSSLVTFKEQKAINRSLMGAVKKGEIRRFMETFYYPMQQSQSIPHNRCVFNSHDYGFVHAVKGGWHLLGLDTIKQELRRVSSRMKSLINEIEVVSDKPPHDKIMNYLLKSIPKKTEKLIQLYNSITTCVIKACIIMNPMLDNWQDYTNLKLISWEKQYSDGDQLLLKFENNLSFKIFDIEIQFWLIYFLQQILPAFQKCNIINSQILMGSEEMIFPHVDFRTCKYYYDFHTFDIFHHSKLWQSMIDSSWRLIREGYISEKEILINRRYATEFGSDYESFGSGEEIKTEDEEEQYLLDCEIPEYLNDTQKSLIGKRASDEETSNQPKRLKVLC